jgi:YHS domain-containing protein
MVTDPVCGMQVDERQAAGQSAYQGETYYFCSTRCKQQFDQDPACSAISAKARPSADWAGTMAHGQAMRGEP